MQFRPRRRTLIIAAAAAAGLAGVVAIPFGANATLPGRASQLTATDGHFGVYTTLGAGLPSTDRIYDGSWAPDGSRLVYVDGTGDIHTIRYDDGTDITSVVEGSDDAGLKSHPVFSATGSWVYWSQQDATDQPGQIYAGTSGQVWYPMLFDDASSYTHPETGINQNNQSELVFEKQAFAWADAADHSKGGAVTGTPDVWGRTSGEQDPKLLISDASSPTLSGDGQMIAFVRTVGGFRQIFTADKDGGNIVQVTTDSVDHDNPAWSSTSEQGQLANARIAFNEGDNVLTMNGAGANITQVTGLSGHPAYQPSLQDLAFRVGGPNRYVTAAATSSSLWQPSTDTSRYAAQAVVLSRGDTFADALGGAALAAAKKGPLLLTDPKSLTPATAAEITRLLGTDTTRTVYVLGSTGAISQAVEDQVKAMGYQVKRIAGPDRFATAVAIADEINPHPNLILTATGMNFPDALGAGAAAGSFDVPGSGSDLSAVVVLTNDGVLPDATRQYLDAQTAYASANNTDFAIFGVGGQAATATESYGALPIAGHNRFETSAGVAEIFFGGEQHVGVATGSNWPDALAGGALMATLNAPMLLAGSTSLDPSVSAVLDEQSASVWMAWLFGSPAVVSDTIMHDVGVRVSGPAGFSSQWYNGTTTNVLNKTTRGATAGPTTPAASAGGGGHRTLKQIVSAAKALGQH